MIFNPHLSLVVSRPILHQGIQESLGFRIPRRGFRISGFCQWNLDSRFLKLYSGFQSSGFLAVDSGFQMMDSSFFLSGIWILGFNLQWDQHLDSLSCISDLQSSGFWIPPIKFAGFRIPQANIWRITEFGFPYLGQLRLPCRLIPLK